MNKPAARVPVTVIVPTLNEASRIAGCLGSVAWAEEIIVADGGSDDDTVRRAKQAGARVLQLPGAWIADQRNAAVEAARHEWIFALDADETASPEVPDELVEILASPTCDAYRIRRRNFLRGVELQQGSWGRDWVTRLFRRDRRYLRSRVHERLAPGPEPGRLRATLVHVPYQDLAHQLAKMRNYAEWAAADLAERGIRASLATLAGRPVLRFCRTYLLDGWWRRGRAGLIDSALAAYGVFLKYAFLFERRPSRDGLRDRN